MLRAQNRLELMSVTFRSSVITFTFCLFRMIISRWSVKGTSYLPSETSALSSATVNDRRVHRGTLLILFHLCGHSTQLRAQFDFTQKTHAVCSNSRQRPVVNVPYQGSAAHACFALEAFENLRISYAHAQTELALPCVSFWRRSGGT